MPQSTQNNKNKKKAPQNNIQLVCCRTNGLYTWEGHHFWITNRPTWGTEPERENQSGKIQAEEEREPKSDGLSCFGNPATVKSVIYSAIISVDIWSESQPGLSHHIHIEWPTRIGRTWFIIQLFITVGGQRREKNTWKQLKVEFPSLSIKSDQMWW